MGVNVTELFLHDQKDDAADCRYSIQTEAGGVLFLFNECGITAREVFETFKIGHERWRCAANPLAAVPQDCEWPNCGCDPRVDRVIAALRESGWNIDPPSPPAPMSISNHENAK
jgi:hypothetical protein